jgi:hypothetical protein
MKRAAFRACFSSLHPLTWTVTIRGSMRACLVPKCDRTLSMSRCWNRISDFEQRFERARGVIAQLEEPPVALLAGSTVLSMLTGGGRRRDRAAPAVAWTQPERDVAMRQRASGIARV